MRINLKKSNTPKIIGNKRQLSELKINILNFLSICEIRNSGK